MKIFNNESSVILKKSLDLLMRQSRNVSENIANVNIPDYQRKPTAFMDELLAIRKQGQLRVTNERHMKMGPSATEPPEGEKGPVILTREMSDLAQNQIRYDFSARMLRRKFDGLTRSITGRIR